MVRHAVGAPPQWHQPVFTADNVVARMTTRAGGVSLPPYDSLNLGQHVGDVPEAVAVNRERFSQALGLVPVRLRQVHGCHVVHVPLAQASASVEQNVPQADASLCTTPGVACEIQVADCMPVLFADRRGRVVGASHAGWRGLAAGVLEATVARMCEAAACQPVELEAWLGPCIGPQRFEVGDEVMSAFTTAMDGAHAWFSATGSPGKWWGDLPGLATHCLVRAGLTRLSGNDGSAGWCTASNAGEFFSFRRDGCTGRMSAAIGLRTVGR